MRTAGTSDVLLLFTENIYSSGLLVIHRSEAEVHDYKNDEFHESQAGHSGKGHARVMRSRLKLRLCP